MLKDRGQRVAFRRGGELLAVGQEEHVNADHDRADPQSSRCCKGCVEVAFTAGVEDMELQPQCARCRVQVSPFGLSGGCVGSVSNTTGFNRFNRLSKRRRTPRRFVRNWSDTGDFGDAASRQLVWVHRS